MFKSFKYIFILKSKRTREKPELPGVFTQSQVTS